MLINQDKSIARYLALVFIPIFIVIIITLLVRNNSFSFLEKKYKSIHNSSYSGKITNLFLNIDNGRTRTILIDNKWNKEIPFFIHEQLKVGDSLYKITESDFEYYMINSNRDTIKRDVNKFYRTKYFNKLKER